MVKKKKSVIVTWWTNTTEHPFRYSFQKCVAGINSYLAGRIILVQLLDMDEIMTVLTFPPKVYNLVTLPHTQNGEGTRQRSGMTQENNVLRYTNKHR